MKKWAAFGFALFLTSPAAIADEKIPDGLAIVQNPGAFVRVCDELTEPKHLAALMRKLEGSDKVEATSALDVVGAMACSALVQGVADTVAVAKEYRIQASNERVCMPEMTVRQIVEKVGELQKTEPETFKADSGVPTSLVILKVLAEEGTCSPSAK